MEEPNCLECIHVIDDYDCEKMCGAKHGWYGYSNGKDMR